MPDGMFSARQAYAGDRSTRVRAIARCTAATTAAAPLMSHFIVVMPSAGLIDSPPESNVIPSPTRARCGTPRLLSRRPRAGVSEIRTRRGGCADLADADDAPVTVSCQLHLVEHLNAHSGRADERCRGDVGKVRGVHVRCWGVDQVPSQPHAFGERLGSIGTRPHLLVASTRRVHRDGTDRRLGGALRVR